LTKDLKSWAPYSRNVNELVLNADDGIYVHQGGKYSLVNLVQLGPRYSAGFIGSITLGVDVEDIG